MLYTDCYEFFEMLRAKKSGKRTVCNFEIKGEEAPALIEYGTANFVGDWSYREIDGGASYCVYCNHENDRMMLIIGFSEHLHCDFGINDGKRWNMP